MEELMPKKSRRGRDKMVGKEVLCCHKGDCGRHTVADLGELIEATVDDGYLRNVRKEKGEKDWENMPTGCWNCGHLFA
jgi:hypothetical protein